VGVDNEDLFRCRAGRRSLQDQGDLLVIWRYREAPDEGRVPDYAERLRVLSEELTGVMN
jgi:hypothetical protein